jgi:hypothetical protein
MRKALFTLSLATATNLFASEKMAILLNVPHYDPTFDDIAIESEVVDGEINSYKVNGKTVEFEVIDELNQKLKQDIEVKNRSYHLKEEIMASHVSSILDEKGIEHKIMGSRIVVNSDDLSNEDIADLTAEYFFVEDVVEEADAMDSHEDVPETLRLTGVDPSFLWDNTPFSVWNQSEQNQPIGVMLWEAGDHCPNRGYEGIDETRLTIHDNSLTDDYHSNIVTHILQASSEKAHIHCMEAEKPTLFFGCLRKKDFNFPVEELVSLSYHTIFYNSKEKYVCNNL